MRTKGVDANAKLGLELRTETPQIEDRVEHERPILEPSDEARALSRKNAVAPSRAISDVPTGGDASLEFFTARGAYDSYLLSHSVRKELAAALGAEAIPFFDSYYRLEAIARDPEAPRPSARALKKTLDDALAALGKTGAASRALNLVWHARHEDVNGTSLDEILTKACRKNDRPSREEWRALSTFFQRAIGTLARDRGVWVTIGREGSEDWPSLRMMSAREKELELIASEDPFSYQLIMERRAFYRERDAAVQKAIARLQEEEGAPVLSRKASIRRRVVTIADVLDGEGGIAKSFVFDVDAKPRSLAEHVEWRDELSRARREIASDDGERRAERILTDFQLASLRVLDDAALPLLPGPIEMHGLSDGTSTRTVATKEYQGTRVVVEGRYAGIPVESLVDRSGRLIESAIEEPGRHEPYLWYDENKKKLVLDFPNKRGEWTRMRQALRKLAQQEEAFEYRSIDRRQPRFSFPVELFEEVERIVGTFRRTNRASEVLNAHFAEQARIEAATRSNDLSRFDAKAIGGFADGVDLWQQQKEALAYLEARGGRGVINLDTGDGKTLVVIAEMLRAIRNGEIDRPGTNGRFLFVCDKDQLGNLPDQIERFCDEKTRKLLLSSIHETDGVRRRGRVDVMSYGELLYATKTGMWKGKPWSPHDYVTAFFDEVHQKLERQTATSEAICSMRAPKVLLTASLVGKNPARALRARYVADGVDLYAPEGAAVRREINKVSRHLSVKVGPYEVGIHPARKLRAKQIFEGVFHRKRAPLAVGLVTAEERLTMQAPVQAAYRMVLDSVPGLREALQGATSLWRDAGAGAAERKKAKDPSVPLADPLDPRIPSLNAIDSELRRGLDLLIDLENRPNHLAVVDGKVIDLFGTDRTDVAPIIDYNPKLRRAAERFEAKLDKSPQSRAAQMIDDVRLVEEAAIEMLRANVPGGHAACLPDRIIVYRHATKRAVEAAKQEEKKQGVEASILHVDDQPVVKLVYRASGREFHTEMLEKLQKMMRSLASDTSIRTLSLYRPTYSHGHNLQNGLIDTVIDLTPPKGHEASHQSLSRFYRQGTEVESVEHVAVKMAFDRSEGTGDGLTDFDVLPSEIQYARNVRERSIYQDSVAAIDEEGLYGGLPPETRSSLIQSRRLFELEQQIASGELVL